MKIAFVSTLKGTPWGGSEELWVAACGRALEAGHDVLISRYEWPQVPPKQARLHEAGAAMQLRPRRTGRIARLLPRPRWLRELEAFAPDVLCLSQGGAYECAGHRSMIPLVRWLRRADTTLVNLIQFNTPNTSLGLRAAVRARYLYQRAAANAFVAQENIEEASRRLSMMVPRAVVVRNPVNLPDTSPISWPDSAGPARLATVARLDARTKGQDMLLETLAAPPWLSRDWRLSLYGVGPDEARFRAMAEPSSLTTRVEFHGHADDVRAIWNTHHILVLPSRAEGTPLAMVEAMLLGRPCVVCAAGGCADWIEDGVEGFIAPKPTVEHVAAALDRAWQARARWPRMGDAARARALRQMGPDPGGDFLRLMIHAVSQRVPPGAPLT